MDSLVSRYRTALCQLLDVIPVALEKLQQSQQLHHARVDSVSRADMGVILCSWMQQEIDDIVKQPAHQFLSKETMQKLEQKSTNDVIQHLESRVYDCRSLSALPSPFAAHHLTQAHLDQMERVVVNVKRASNASVPSLPAAIATALPPPSDGLQYPAGSRLVMHHIMKQSKILKKNEWANALIGWLPRTSFQEKPSLLFQGSRDG